MSGAILLGVLLLLLLGALLALFRMEDEEEWEAEDPERPSERERLARWLSERWARAKEWHRRGERALRRRLAEADLPWRPVEFIGLVLGATALGTWIGLAVYRLPGLVLLGAAAGAALPFLFLRHRREARRRRLEGQLADALFLIAGVLRTGGSLGRQPGGSLRPSPTSSAGS